MRMESRHGDGIANSKFISYLDNVTQEIVWVVDSNRQLLKELVKDTADNQCEYKQYRRKIQRQL